MKKYLLTFFLLFFTMICFGNQKYVIYLTLDGVRWQDVFLDHTYFKKFWEKYSKLTKIYGEPESHTTMEVASVPISLPSYQSQMAGTVQPCSDNDCNRIMVETFPEKLKQILHLQKKDIAVFGSWYFINYAAEHLEGTIVTNSGNALMIDPDTQKPDTVMQAINDQQLIDFPEDPYTRYDKYTFAQAMHYFEKYKPRFLWIALNDADENAHENNIEGYHAILSFYDDVIDQIFTQLQLSHLAEETTVIITTDHGRNNHWTDHGEPESKQTFAFAMNAALVPLSESDGTFQYSTLSIRPTIEKVFINH